MFLADGPMAGYSKLNESQVLVGDSGGRGKGATMGTTGVEVISVGLSHAENGERYVVLLIDNDVLPVHQLVSMHGHGIGMISLGVVERQ